MEITKKDSRYPKCTIAKADDTAPLGPKSFSQLFSWPERFIEAVATRYGHDVLSKRLMGWSWQASTCFSGVGCAESAT